jgi:membrane protease YdiL (CAAX protease family)
MKKNTLLYIMIVLAIAGILYSIRMFDKAFPIVNVQITADKQNILNKADSLTQALGLMEGEYRSVVRFDTDEAFKNYVELEGGGIEVFQSIIEEETYYPYTWVVRQFNVNEVPEISYIFSPGGVFLGFRKVLPDTLSGKDVAEFDVREIFLRSDARSGMLPDMSGYELIERSSELKEGGRRDHVFTFERSEGGPGDAQYRIKIGVSGDVLTMIRHEVKIPEAFERRYEEMRSANNTISFIGMAVMAILYGLLGVGVSLFFMLRRRTLIWRPPLKWSILIGVSMFLAYLTTISLSWFQYDTSLSANQFIFQQTLVALLNGLLTAVLFFLSAMAAEGLDRQAFPEHIRFWRSWSPTVGASREITRQTAFGYLWAFFMIGFVTFFYWITNNVFQWWSPAENMMDPNILALPFPWLLPSAISLNAGFWEECLFRAVPLAGAILIGKHFRKKRIWIAIALIFQAVIFGSLHANYAQQPAYARIVEMLIPFMLYGLIYIKWGLLPVVVSHFVYDIVLMGMPLFLLSAPGMWFHRILLVVAALIPMLIPVYRRIRAGTWYEIQSGDLNASFETEIKETPEKERTIIPETPLQQSRSFPVLAAVAALIIGGGLWFVFTSFEQDIPKLEIKRDKALLIADAFIEQRYPETDTLGLKPYVRLVSGTGRSGLFIWEHSDRQSFYDLYEKTLAANYYEVAYKTFEGDVERRSETVTVMIGRKGDILGWYHHVPEARPGATLQEVEARALAEHAIERHYKMKIADLEPVQVLPEKQTARMDWKFIYRDVNTGLSEGDVRYTVRISGDALSGLGTEVHLTESWERDHKKKNILRTVLSGISGVIRFGMLVAILVMGIIAWTRRQFNVNVFILFLAGFMLISLSGSALMMNAMFNQFPTSEPLLHLVLISVIGVILASLFGGFIYGISTGYLSRLPLPYERNESYFTLKGIGLGVGFAAVIALAKGDLLKQAPVVLSPGQLDSLMPLLSTALSGIEDYFVLLVRLIAPMAIAFLLWKKSKAGALILLFLSGFMFAGRFEPGWWLLSGAVAGAVLMLLYYYVLRYNFLYIPIIAVVILVLGAVRTMLAAPAVLSVPDGLIRIILAIAMGVVTVWGMHQLFLAKHDA